jgi:nitroimidazol reductase NimA-like FMN-containing flavoprotein (pyridoxamine 5'-phosphate oxidase superfamily)
VTEDLSELSFAQLRTRKLAKMEPDRLREHIVRFLQANNICVLATCRDDVPRATPLEYWADGTTLYVVADYGTKVKNLEANPRISVGIANVTYTDWTDWARVAGVQITGRPSFVDPKSAEYEQAMRVYKWQHYADAAEFDPKAKITRRFIKIEAEKIELRDLGLLREGYSRKQVWEAPSRESS